MKWGGYIILAGTTLGAVGALYTAQMRGARLADLASCVLLTLVIGTLLGARLAVWSLRDRP